MFYTQAQILLFLLVSVVDVVCYPPQVLLHRPLRMVMADSLDFLKAYNRISHSDFCHGLCQVKYFDTCFEKRKVRHWSIFFRLGVVFQIKIKSTKCRTWPFFSTNSRIRRVVMFDERVFDEKSCTGFYHNNS